MYWQPTTSMVFIMTFRKSLNIKAKLEFNADARWWCSFTCADCQTCSETIVSLNTETLEYMQTVCYI